MGWLKKQVKEVWMLWELVEKKVLTKKRPQIRGQGFDEEVTDVELKRQKDGLQR